MESPREARRRRIVERGTDRLAFITGQVRSVPSLADQQQPPPPQQHNEEEEKEEEDPPRTVASAHEDDIPGSDLPKYQVTDQIDGGIVEVDTDTVENDSGTVENDSGTVESDTEKELFPKCKMGRELPRRAKSNEIPKYEISTEFPEEANHETAKIPYERSTVIPGANNEFIADVQHSDRSAELFSTSVAQSLPEPVGSVAPSIAKHGSLRNFTPSQISRSISASENIRLLCAVTIALLVVLSYHGYSMFGKLVGSIVNFRPLFLVLLTDATIIIANLFLTEGRYHRDVREARSGQGGTGEGIDIGKALETAMVSQKALGAVFMDCSICAVIIICGLVV